MKSANGPDAFVFGAVGLISAIGLAYEIVLLRVFSFSQWHHFASLAVALALLGFGAAGTVLTLLGERAKKWGDSLFLTGLLIGALGIVVAYWISISVSIRPLFAVWDSGELLKLLFVDFFSFIPFLGLAISIGQVFVRWPNETTRLYAAHLIGSGTGSLVAALMIANLYLESVTIWMPVIILLAGSAYAWGRRACAIFRWGSLAGAIVLLLWIQNGVPQLPLSDFKRLSYLLDLPNAETLERVPGLRDEIRVIRSDNIRIASGLSTQWMEAVPAQDALTIGSDLAIPLPREGKSTEYRQATLAALPFLLRPEGLVAWLGVSEWLPVDKDREIEWVVENPQIREIMVSRGVPDDWILVQGESRRYLDTAEKKFSVIVYGRSANERDAASEDYLLTREGLKAGLANLDQNGILAVPIPLSNPPRRAPKLLSMAVSVLNEGNRGNPSEQIAMLRSLHTGLLLISPSKFSQGMLNTIRNFADRWSFDLVALADLKETKANRHHRWSQPILYRSAQAILTGEGSIPAESLWYSMEPASDWRPYFLRTMRWRALPELLQELGRPGLVWLDWALLAMAVKLVVAGLLAAILVLLPLGKLPKSKHPLTRFRIGLYFAMLGLGYLLVEMAAFQRSIHYVGHPVVAATLVFAAFLIGSGLGSMQAPTEGTKTRVARIFVPILVLGVFSFALLELGSTLFLALPDGWRYAGIGLVFMPLAWSMGRAMPWGLRQLDALRPAIPWAWGINGFASVLAAPLASLLAVHASQLAPWLGGELCYVTAGIIALSWIRS